MSGQDWTSKEDIIGCCQKHDGVDKLEKGLSFKEKNHEQDHPEDACQLTFAEKFKLVWKAFSLGDWAVIVVFGLLVLLAQFLRPRHQLINVNNLDISYPLKDETVPMWLLLFLTFGIPMLIFFVLYTRHRFFSWDSPEEQVRRNRAELYRAVIAFTFGLVTTLIATEFGKRLVGRPRPNFLAMSGYVPSDNVLVEPEWRVDDAFQSFPSGHASFSFSGLGFISMLLFYKLFPSGRKQTNNQAWKVALCLLPLGFASWIASTRVTDFYHRCDDVVAGAILGLTVTLLAFYYQFYSYHELYLPWTPEIELEEETVQPEPDLPPYRPSLSAINVIAAVPYSEFGPSSEMQRLLPSGGVDSWKGANFRHGNFAGDPDCADSDFMIMPPSRRPSMQGFGGSRSNVFNHAPNSPFHQEQKDHISPLRQSSSPSLPQSSPPHTRPDFSRSQTVDSFNLPKATNNDHQSKRDSVNIDAANRPPRPELDRRRSSVSFIPVGHLRDVLQAQKHTSSPRPQARSMHNLHSDNHSDARMGRRGSMPTMVRRMSQAQLEQDEKAAVSI